ncbi:chloride channel protein [Klebsormidium nitens]|uniref:Chloride channel protein n=1 Tax=Klebsormidium nitens TaxID=105231 RepID=A0A1Y1IHS0_KLENI|nr:chloride channel protein [Klebsormidium nitens]|eukprot:GAQ89049.1 chloride channel protein [Klebsormidium nitens]
MGNGERVNKGHRELEAGGCRGLSKSEEALEENKCQKMVRAENLCRKMEKPLLEEISAEAQKRQPSLTIDEIEDCNRDLNDGEDYTLENSLESQDYDSLSYSQSSSRIQEPEHKHVFGYSGSTLAKYITTITIGILTGMVAFGMESTVEVIIEKKNEWLQDTLITRSPYFAYFGAVLFGIGLISVAVCLVSFWAPAAAGGGVTLVIAYLNGIAVPDFLRGSTLITKIIGTICTTTSGLALGPEAPLVHIGSAIASALTWPVLSKRQATTEDDERGDRSWIERLTHPAGMSYDFHNDVDRREFISAGAAAGLAAVFGAPIGGVLFSLEEASSFWSRKVMWRSLLSCACATLTLSFLHERRFSLSFPGLLAFRGLKPIFKLQELPFFFVTAAAAGVLGSLLNLIHGKLNNFRPCASRKGLRILEACTVVTLSISAVFILSQQFGRCLPQPDEWHHPGTNEHYGIKFTCKQVEGEPLYYNDLATMFMSVPHETIKKLFKMSLASQGHRVYFTLPSLAIFASAFFSMFCLAYGLAVPGGLFMPSIMTGASFGGVLGCLFQMYFKMWEIEPGLHALIGATAMLGGVFRSSISLVVIMVEGTGGINFILPIILAVVMANWVSHHLHPSGAYESDIEKLSHIPFLHAEAPRKLLSFRAEDIMAHNVVGFREIVRVADVVQILRKTLHNGFPVFSEDGRLVGLILRSQLLVLLEHQHFVPMPQHPGHRSSTRRDSFSSSTSAKHRMLERAMRMYHLIHNPHRRYLNSTPETVDALNVDRDRSSEAERALLGGEHDPENGGASSSPNGSPTDAVGRDVANLALDLTPFMNRAPLTVRRECSAQRVYILFRSLGLRHLLVVSSRNLVIGIITRKDLVNAERTFEGRIESYEDQVSRHSRQATPNTHPSITSPIASSPTHHRAHTSSRSVEDVLFSLP